jgi:hypothetical protein
MKRFLQPFLDWSGVFDFVLWLFEHAAISRTACSRANQTLDWCTRKS